MKKRMKMLEDEEKEERVRSLVNRRKEEKNIEVSGKK